MSQIVVDASVALAWCFADEQSPYPQAVLDQLDTDDAVVPQFFWIEVANAMMVAERRGRIGPTEIARFADLLRRLQIETDAGQEMRALTEIRPFAQKQDLTVYDAVYLDLAMRKGLELATLDEALIRAAGNTRVTVFTPPAS